MERRQRSELERDRQPERTAGRGPLVPRRTQASIQTIVESEPLQILEWIIVQRAGGIDLEVEDGDELGLSEEASEGEDPDYEGRGADEDDDFSEVDLEEPDSILEALEARRPDEPRPLKPDIRLELIRECDEERIVVCATAGALWLKARSTDRISLVYKNSLRRRMRALALLASRIVELNRDDFINLKERSQKKPERMTRKEAVQFLRRFHKVEEPKSSVSRLVNSAHLQLPDGEILPFEAFFEPYAQNPTAAWDLFLTLAARYKTEKEGPFSDRQLADSINEVREQLGKRKKIGRSRVQQVRSSYLPSSRDRRAGYKRGLELSDLLKEEAAGDPERMEELINVLTTALERAQRLASPEFRLAATRLERWLQALESGAPVDAASDIERGDEDGA